MKKVILLIIATSFFLVKNINAQSGMLDTASLSKQKVYTSLSEALASKETVYRLHISDNSLTALTDIGKLTNLQDLMIYSNKITQLPPEIGKLKNLQTLWIMCKLTALPPEIGNLINLNYLNLELNKLESLPPEIGNLSKLETLFLMFNRLKSLPSEIGNLKNLTGINLCGNKLSSVPSSIKNLINLTYLNLAFDNLNENGIDNLKKSLPNCYIENTKCGN